MRARKLFFWCFFVVFGSPSVGLSSALAAEMDPFNSGASEFAASATAPTESKRPANCPEVERRVLTPDNFENLGWIMKNPNASCDMSLSLPGLPDFGLSVDKLDHCEIIKKTFDKKLGSIMDRIQSHIDQASSDASIASSRVGVDVRALDQPRTEANVKIGVE